jgi:hypothetical protein
MGRTGRESGETSRVAQRFCALWFHLHSAEAQCLAARIQVAMVEKVSSWRGEGGEQCPHQSFLIER